MSTLRPRKGWGRGYYNTEPLQHWSCWHCSRGDIPRDTKSFIGHNSVSSIIHVLVVEFACITCISMLVSTRRTSLTLPDPRRQPVIAYSMNARRERVWDTTVPGFVLAPPELGGGGDNWLISSLEVGDAHVNIQMQAKRALLEAAKDMGHQTLKAKQG